MSQPTNPPTGLAEEFGWIDHGVADALTLVISAGIMAIVQRDCFDLVEVRMRVEVFEGLVLRIEALEAQNAETEARDAEARGRYLDNPWPMPSRVNPPAPTPKRRRITQFLAAIKAVAR